MTKTRKTLHVLPQEVVDAFKTLGSERRNTKRDDYIVALRKAEWTLESIATAADLTRERVRQIVKTWGDQAQPVDDLPIPSLPTFPERKPPEYIEPSPAILSRLLELQPAAQEVRANSPKNRHEAEEYTRLLWDAHRPQSEGGEGVTLYRLAKRLGVSHGAIRFRLVRYGYLKPKTGTSKVYTPILDKNRV